MRFFLVGGEECGEGSVGAATGGVQVMAAALCVCVTLCHV